jgi:hypothetical protein
MKKSVACALSILTGASISFATAQIFKLSGTSSIEVSPSGEGQKITKIETTFVEQFYIDTPKIYKVTTRKIYSTNVDGSEDRTHVEAYAAKDAAFSDKTWTLKVKGGDFKVFNDYLVQTTEYGCCDSPNLNHMINTATGKEIVVALNDSTTEFTVPNSKLASRYLAHVQDAKAPEKKGTRTYIGTIGYFEASRLKGMARVYAALPAGWGASFDELKPVLRERDQHFRNTVTLWSADGVEDANLAFTGSGLQSEISFSDKTASFSIVIEKDQLSAGRSKASSELELEFVKVK